MRKRERSSICVPYIAPYKPGVGRRHTPPRGADLQTRRLRCKTALNSERFHSEGAEMQPTSKKPAILGIDTTTYLVKDVERAKKFYRDVIGLPLTGEFENQGCEFVMSDNTAFGLWKMRDGSWTQGNGVLFSVSDFDAAIEYYKGAGVKIAPHIEDTPNCKMAFAEDTEGNTFVL